MELLVVVAIMIVLAALLFGVTARMIRAAYKADSLSDLRSLGTMTMAATGDNSGRFPLLHSNLVHPHHYNKRNDVDPSVDDRFTLEDMIESGLTKDTAFCMANRQWSRRADFYWNEFGGGRSAVFSYVYLANDNGWADDKNRIKFPTDDPRLAMFSGRKARSLPALPSHSSEVDVWYPYLWADLCRRFDGSLLANFMKNEDEAAGMNILFLDGHIEWRSGAQIKERYSAGSIQFYW
ncbi:MAG: type II secretion system protein [Akkermansiaceae bacterium]|nr:type II secretion system protein [Akkermansiaceae bacterium]